jgi:predicted extracellular nuclease
MKKVHFFGLALLFCGCGEMNQTLNEETSMDAVNNLNNSTVLFYNMENLFDTFDDPTTLDDDFTPFGRQAWDDERYEHKLEQLALVIHNANNQNPSIIGAVEVENYRVLEDLSKAGMLKNSAYKIAHFDSDDRRGIDCGLLYDSEKLNLISQKEVPVKTNSGGYVTRDILQVEFSTLNNEKLTVFVNHWSSRREGVKETEPKRLLAAERLREAMEQQIEKDPAVKILIMGDFNDQPEDKSMIEALQANKKSSNSDLVNLMNDSKFEEKGTIVYQRNWYLFDHFVVSRNLLESEGLKIDERSVNIYRDNSILYTYKDGGQKPNSTYGGPKYFGGYSDHLPIYLSLKE